MKKLRSIILSTLVRLFMPRHPLGAIKFLQNMLRIFPNDSYLHMALAETFWVVSNVEQAIKNYEITLGLDPDHLYNRRSFGTLLLILSRFKQASREFQYCIDHFPPRGDQSFLANVYGLQALSFVMGEELMRAEEILEEARRISPWDLDVLTGTVSLFYASARVEEIPELLNDYQKTYPRLYVVDGHRGHCQQYFLYDIPGCIQSYEQALENWGDKKRRKYCAQFWTGEFAFNTIIDEYIEALVTLQQTEKAWRLAEKIWGEPDAKYASARRKIDFYLLTQDFQQAENACEELLKKQKIKDPALLLMLATAQHKLGNDESAIQNVNHVLSLHKQNYQALQVLGEIQLDRGEWESAVQTFEVLRSLYWFSIGCLEKLGKCYVSVNRLEDARTAYETAAKLDPLNAEIWVDLGEVYFFLNQYELAESACKRALAFDRLPLEKQEVATRILQSDANS